MARLWTDSQARNAARPRPEGAFDAYAPRPGSSDAANHGYGRGGEDDIWARYAEPGSNDAANYGYGRQGADSAGGFAPDERSNDAANYGYGRQGVDGYAGGYAPPRGSNDAANYGYGREGLDHAPNPDPAATVLRVIDDLSTWSGADPTLPSGTTMVKENDVSDSKSEGIRKQLDEDWMIDATRIAISVAGDEAKRDYEEWKKKRG